MSYFDPKIYNKNNLHEADKKELDYWESVFINLIENTLFDFECGEGTLGKIKKEVAEEFSKELRTQLGYELQENVVSIIDAYEEDIEEVEDPDTYFYEEEEDGESDHDE